MKWFSAAAGRAPPYEGANIEGRDPPQPPLGKGGGACGRAIADCAASTTSARVGGRSQTVRREHPLATPPNPPFVRGGRLACERSQTRGENYLCALPPCPSDRHSAGGWPVEKRAAFAVDVITPGIGPDSRGDVTAGST